MPLLDCPRCHQLLRDPTDVGPPEAVAGHHCDSCDGVWLPGDRLAVVYPALKDHGDRISELLDKGARRGTVVTCPSCGADTLEFPFFDLWLDLCERCHGVWIDGEETHFVKKHARRDDGVPGSAATDARVTCACGASIHPRRTLMTAEGPLCDDCVRSMRSESAGVASRAFNMVTGFLDWMGKQNRRWL